MKWLTKAQVKRAAETSHAAAVRCSQKHWLQLSSATAKELRTAPSAHETLVFADYCALCQRYLCKEKTCVGCPLRSTGAYGDCCKEWVAVATLFDDLPVKWHEWKRAAKAMYERVMKIESPEKLGK